VTIPPALVETPANQRRTDAFALPIGANGEGRECDSLKAAAFVLDRDQTERDVADNLLANFRHTRKNQRPRRPKCIHQSSFARSAKGSSLDLADRPQVGSRFPAQLVTIRSRHSLSRGVVPTITVQHQTNFGWAMVGRID